MNGAASRAFRSTAPLLAKASSVTLVTALEEGEDKLVDLPPTEGAEYLSRHGIACEMSDLLFTDSSVAGSLALAAASLEASYLVMGAFGHSRLRETTWGAVTRELFSKPPLPILASY